MLSGNTILSAAARSAILRSSRKVGVTLTLLAMLGQILVAPHAARAASETWTGSGDDTTWSNGSNWSGLAAPGSTSVTNSSDVATFNTSPGNTITIDQLGQNIGGITFDYGTGDYTIGASGVNLGHSLLLSSGGTIQITSAVAFNASQVFNAPLVLEPATASTAGSYTFANNSTTPNSLTFAGNISGGTTSAGVTLNLAGANTSANVISGSISDGGAAGFVGVTKSGTGYWSLAPTVAAGPNTYSGATTVNAGTLNLDYTNVPTNVVANASHLVMGGGRLTITPNATGATSQTFASTTITGGTTSAIVANSNANGTNLALGALTFATTALATANAGAVDFTLPTNGSITTTTANASSPNGNGSILGFGATVGGTTWAVSAGNGTTAGAITGLATGSYVTNPAVADGNLDFPTGASSVVTGNFNSFRFNNAGSYTLTLSGSTGVTTGGILETSNVGANPITINGGTITVNGGGYTLNVIQNNTAAAMTINSALASTSGLDKSGAGELILGYTNAFSNPTYITGGTLQYNNGLGSTEAVVDNAVLALNTPSTSYGDPISGTGVVNLLSGTATLSGTNTYSGGTNINGGTLVLGSAGAIGTGPISFGSTGGALEYSASNTTDYSARIVNSTAPISINTNGQNITFATALAASNTGGLTKSGAGTLTLSGVNNYTGTTSVSGGTLAEKLTAGSNAISTGALTLGGGTLQITGAANANTQTVGNLTFNAGASNITLVPNGSTAANLLTTGTTWTANSGAAVNFTLGGAGAGAGLQAAVGTLNGVVVGSGVTAFATVGGTDWASLNGSNQIVALGSSGSIGSYTADTWAAGNNTTVTTNDAPASASTTSTLQFANATAGDTVTLTGVNTISTGGILVSSAVGAFNNVITGGTLNPGAGNEYVIQQFNTGGTLTIGSILANNGSNATALTTAGPGTTILAGANTYTGGTYIGGGNLQVGNGVTASSLGSSSAAIHDNGSLIFNNPLASPLTLSGVLSGAGTITQNGAGPVTFSNTANSLGGVTQAGSGALTLAGAVSGAGGVTMTSPSTGAVTLSGVLSFSGGITDAGSGVLTLSNTGNTFTGNISVSSGTLAASGSDAVLGSLSNSITLSNGADWNFEGNFTTSRALVLGTGGGTLSSSAGGDQYFSGTITGGTGLTVTSGDFIPTPSAPATIGTIDITGGRVLAGGAGGSGGNTNFIASNSFIVANGADLDIGSGGTVTLTNTMNFASGSVFSERNTAVNVNTSSNTVTFPTAGSMTFQEDDESQAGQTMTDKGSWQLTGPLTLQVGWTVSGHSLGAVELAGVVSGGPTDGLTKTGINQLILAAANTLSGATTISQGTIQLANANALQDSAVSLSSGAANPLVFNTGIHTFTIGGLAGSDNQQLLDNTSTPAAVTLQIGNNAAENNTYSGVLSGGGGLALVGTGTQTLSGANLYSGGTSVTAGTLNVNNTSGSGTGSAAVTLTGGILAGSGNIAGAVSIGGGTINPGAINGTSVLSLGSLTLDSHGVFAINIAASAGSAGPTPVAGTNYDAVDITAVTSGAQATLGLAALNLNDSSYREVAGQTFDILHFNTANGPSSSGMFSYNGNALANDATFTDANGNSYQIFYGTAPGYGNDVVLTAVPEPGTLVLAGLGIAGFAAWRLRRRRPAAHAA